MNSFEKAWRVLKQYNDPRAADAMGMFQQVQAAKLARQEQMMGGGLNPMTGAPQPQAQAPQAQAPQQPAPQQTMQQPAPQQTMQQPAQGGQPSTGAIGGGSPPPATPQQPSQALQAPQSLQTFQGGQTQTAQPCPTCGK